MAGILLKGSVLEDADREGRATAGLRDTGLETGLWNAATGTSGCVAMLKAVIPS